MVFVPISEVFIHHDSISGAVCYNHVFYSLKRKLSMSVLAKDKAAFIINADKLSLSDYCAGVRSWVGASEGMAEMLACAHDLAEHENERRVYSTLLPLANDGVLPDLSGVIGFSSILEASDFPHENYIATQADDSGKLSVFVYDDDHHDGQLVQLPVDSVNVISPLQESEVIATSTKVPGHYFIVYHDGDVETLAISDESFIKAMCALSLMHDEAVFYEVLEAIPRNEEFNRESALAVLQHLLSAKDTIVDETCPGASDQLHQRYSAWRKAG